MTTSELILSTIASRLAIMVVLGLLAHLPDQRQPPPMAQAIATEMSAAGPQVSRLENKADETAGHAD